MGPQDEGLPCPDHARVIRREAVVGCVGYGERSKLFAVYIENRWVEKGCWRTDNDERVGRLRDASRWKEHWTTTRRLARRRFAQTRRNLVWSLFDARMDRGRSK